MDMIIEYIELKHIWYLSQFKYRKQGKQSSRRAEPSIGVSKA